jgi:hypothetical protein
MKRHLAPAGKAVAAVSLAGLVSYLVATVPTHVHIYWPYWVLLGGVVVGVGLYFAGQERERKVRVDAVPPPKVEDITAPAVTDRWQSSLDGVSSEMLQLQNNMMGHPGYARRSPTETPPSVRIGMRVACAQLAPAAASSQLRAAFHRFLEQSAVMDLVHELTEIADGAVWTSRDDNPPVNFGAVLATPDTEEAPVAWARVLLPETLTRLYGRDATSAYLVLYVEPRTSAGTPALAASLADWHRHLSGVLKLPAAFAEFLGGDISLATTADPPAEVGVWLKAPHALTELVEVDAFDVVAGSSRSNWFMGFAVASSEGEQSSGMVQAWLRQLCDSSLRLNNYEADLASLDARARLSVRVIQDKREKWEKWEKPVKRRDAVYIAALEVELSNTTDSPVRIAAVDLKSDSGAGSPEDLSLLTTEMRGALDSEADLRRDRYAPQLASQRSVPPHGSVTGWVCTALTRLPSGGTPRLELSVREAVGTVYLTVIPPTDRQVPDA